MPTLFVREYAEVALMNGVATGIPKEPALAAYSIAITAGSLAGPALNSRTRFLQLHCDAICAPVIDAVTVGPTDPVADVTKDRMPANATILRGVDPVAVQQSLGMKVAVITST